MMILRQAAWCATMAMLLGACSHGPQHGDGLSVTLTGAQEVPANTSAASGSGTILIGGNRSVTGGVRYTGLLATMAHIHEAPVGANGAVIVSLVKTGEGMFAVPSGTVLTPSQYASYLAGGLYVNVHSVSYPAGEIRAQLQPK